jgi:general secretion pathway protein J
MKNEHSTGEHGFTLLELMIALTLLGVMLTMVYSVFATALAAVPRGEDVAAQSARMRAATSLMSRQVRSIIPVPMEGEDESTPCYFAGNSNYFDFFTAAPQHNGGEGLARVLYWTDGSSLTMAEQLVLVSSGAASDQPAPVPAANAILLLTGLTGARFQYLWQEGDDSEWRDSWDSFAEQMLPAAVSVRLDGIGVGNSYWLQEIPIMPVVFGLGSYDCESGFGNKDQEDGGNDAKDGGNGTTPSMRSQQLPKALQGAEDGE